MSETRPEGIDDSTVYLSDGAYVKCDGESVIIFTHNGYHPTNSVYLEFEAIPLLIKYLDKWRVER